MGRRQRIDPDPDSALVEPTDAKRHSTKGRALLAPGPYRTTCVSVLGGLIFLLFFYWSYSGIPGSYYQVRDDGVITLSHARNWTDYGFIGVNPSGERVEGYSAPAQLFLYAVTYAATGIGYEAFSAAQTALATFLLGAVFINFFRKDEVLAVVLTFLAALLLSHHTSFLLWHGSGMENALTHVFFLAMVFVLYRAIATGSVAYSSATIVFLATITRVENIYHVGPLLLLFGYFWLTCHRSRGGLYFSGLVVGLWALFNLWRYIYFGDLFPNTAYAQGISLTERVQVLLEWRAPELEASWDAAKAVFSSHGGYLLLVAAPLLGLAARNGKTLFLTAALVSLVVTSCLAPIVFGPARMDETRTSTQMAVASVLSVAAIVYHMRNRRWLARIASAAVAAIAVLVSTFGEEPRYVCCDGRAVEGIRQELLAIAQRESLPRPTVAIPELGVTSWHKQFNIVDLGMLGSPIMAASLRSRTNVAWVADYFLDYARPDIVETHSAWSCRWNRILTDQRFHEIYRPLRVRVNNWTRRGGCKDNPESLSGIWVRTDVLKASDSPERRLLDDLTGGVSTRRLRDELRQCQATSRIPHGCVYVARSAYRFLPEFTSRGLGEELLELFSTSRTREFDQYLLSGYGNARAHEPAVEFIRRRSHSFPVTPQLTDR